MLRVIHTVKLIVRLAVILIFLNSLKVLKYDENKMIKKLFCGVETPLKSPCTSGNIFTR